MGAIAPRILVVDDDRMQRQAMRLGLEARGFAVREAEDGLSGLAAVRAEKPDLVLLDLSMPVMGGLGFLSSLDVAALELPVIVVSALGDVAQAASAFKLGAVDYVQKPVGNFDLLAQTLRNALGRGDLARQARQADRRYHMLVENVPMVVFLMGADLRLRFVNRHLAGMLGLSEEESVEAEGWLVDRAVPGDRQALREMLLATVTGQDRPRSMQCRLLRSDGLPADGLVKVIPLGADLEGHPLVEGIILDITERVALERFLVQREKLKTLGAITAGLAHELRNPITAIGGFARRLQDRCPDTLEAGIILGEACRLEAILGRIQEYLNPLRPRGDDCQVELCLRQAVAVLAPELEARRLAVAVESGDGCLTVQEDPDALRQVVITLLRHVAAHLPEGGRARLAAFASGDFVRIELSSPDWAGAGDPEDLLVPFNQAGAESGLPFARRVLDMMGGSLSLSNEDGATAVSVIVPSARPRENPDEQGP